MTVNYQAAGAIGAGTTSISTHTLPASLADGDAALMMVVAKPDTAPIVTPTGWTPVPGSNVAGGGGTTGDSVGPTRQAWFYRIKDSSWSSPPTVTITGGTAAASVIARLTRTGEGDGFDFATATGAYGTGGATTDGTTLLGSDPGIEADDLLLVGYSSMDDAPAWSAEGVTALGVAVNTAVERSEAIETTLGFDIGGLLFTAVISAGTSAGPPTTAATASVATRGTVVLIRARESVPRTPEDGTARITRVTHRITGEKWLTTFGFTTEGGVAQPQVTPSPPAPRPSTWWPEMKMLHGAKSMCPPDFLVMDGSAFDVATYPELAAHLISLGLASGVLPNMTDVFPIGAGTKAVQTTGGNPTKPVPPHVHPGAGHTHPIPTETMNTAANTTITGAATRVVGPADHSHGGATGAASAGNTGAASGAAFDVMPPWRATYFIIRAR